jgi:hypothetical protein
MGPHSVMTRLVSAEHFAKPTLGAFSMFFWAERVFRSHPMPHQLEAMKLAGGARQASRDMLNAVLLAGLFAIPVCFWVYLDGYYRLGAATARIGPWGTGFGSDIFGQLEGWLKNPSAQPTGRWGAIAVGVGIAGALSVIRGRLPGFPLHPLGYAVANSWGMANLWIPILIGSICKGCVLKAGGLRSYRKATMFFFGLMLGEFFVGCTWTIIGMVFGLRTYDFWP